MFQFLEIWPRPFISANLDLSSPQTNNGSLIFIVDPDCLQHLLSVRTYSAIQDSASPVPSRLHLDQSLSPQPASSSCPVCDLHHHHTHPPRAYESRLYRGTYLQPDLDVLRPSPSLCHRRTQAPTLVKPTDALPCPPALPDLPAACLPCLACLSGFPAANSLRRAPPAGTSLDTGRPGRIAGKTLAPRVVIVVRCRHLCPRRALPTCSTSAHGRSQRTALNRRPLNPTALPLPRFLSMTLVN